MISLTVDGRKVEVPKGVSVLRACLMRGIYIPNLCYLEGRSEPAASCRLCFVEIEGYPDPVLSCTTEVRDGMVVRTDSAKVRRLQVSGFHLLMSAHPVLCSACPANKRCDLQKIARHLRVGLRPKGLEPIERPQAVDQGHPHLSYHPYRCVLCERCISACKGARGHPLISLAKRGMETAISFFGVGNLASDGCPSCQACVRVCPVMALTPRDLGS
jgi:NADH dehydrogenase/NADH:ubiquinone oxidoreductase subunit G